MVLLEHRRRFLQPVFEALGGFEGLEAAGPAALPVQGQGAEANDGDAKAMSGDERDTVSLEMSTGFAMPFSIRSTMSWDNGIDQVLFMTMAPITPDRSYYTFVLWRNDDVSETGSDIVDFELQVTDEDRQMLENLRGELPLHPGGVADVAADRASVEWRRRYRHLISGSSV